MSEVDTMLRRARFSLGMIFLAMPVTYAQQAEPAVPPSTFEVSTVKLSPAGQRDYWFRHRGPQVFEANNHTIRECIAYFFDVFPGLVSGGPHWFDSDHYLITAKLPDDVRPSPGELKRMFQALLTERFKLRFTMRARKFLFTSWKWARRVSGWKKARIPVGSRS